MCSFVVKAFSSAIVARAHDIPRQFFLNSSTTVLDSETGGTPWTVSLYPDLSPGYRTFQPPTAARFPV